MAISIDDFRKSLNEGLSRDLVQEIITKYENFDFSSVNTNNGSKLREIDAYDEENISKFNFEDLKYFLNNRLKTDYLVSRGAYLKTFGSEPEEQKRIIADVSKILKNSLYSRPNTLTISSKVILDNPQRDEASHLLVINTDSSSIISIVNSLYEQFSKLDIPFEIEIPKTNEMNSGTTEPIKLHVTTMDLESTINVINKLDKVYKDKIKKPNMFAANVQNTFGYDSLIDINGTRASDVLGSAIVKAIDATLVDLGKDKKIDDSSIVDYLKNATNKDEARQKAIKTIKVDYPNIIEPVLLATVKKIEEEKLAINPNQVFLSEMAASELNVEFGVFEDEITNVNEIIEENEETKTNNVIKEAAASVATNVKSGIISIKDLFANQYIQPAVTFGAESIEKISEEANSLDQSDSLKVENPTVTVIEPLPKAEELQELNEKQLDTLNEDIKPVFTGEETSEMALPGEEGYVQTSTPVVAPTIDAAPVIVNPEVAPTTLVGEEIPTGETPATVVEETPTQAVVDQPVSVQEPVVEPQIIEQPTLANTESDVLDIKIPELPDIANAENNVVEEPVAVEGPTIAEEPGIIEQPVTQEVSPVEQVEVTPIVAPAVDQAPIAVQPEIVTEQAPAVETEIVAPIEPVQAVAPVEDLEKTQIVPTIEPEKVQEQELPSGIKEVITPEVNPVPEFVKPPEEIFAPTKEEQDLQNEIDTALNNVQNAEVDTRTIEIPTEEIKEENDDILSAINSNLDVPDSSKLSNEEKISMVADSFTKTPAVDPARQAIIDKYNGIFIDNQVLDFRIKDQNNEEIIKEDGTPYTFLDYLEDNHVLENIDLNAKYNIKDNPNIDEVDGKNFIREFVISNAVNGNRSIQEIMDWYVSDKPKKKGLFGLGKK